MSVLADMVIFYNHIDEYNKAIETVHKVRNHPHIQNTDTLKAGTSMILGIAHLELDEYHLAEQFLLEGLRQLTDYNSCIYKRQCLTNLGILYADIGSYGKAIKMHRQSLKLYHLLKQDKSYGYGLALGNLGNCYRYMGKSDSAIAILSEAIQITGENYEKDLSRYSQIGGSPLQNINNGKKISILLNGLGVAFRGYWEPRTGR